MIARKWKFDRWFENPTMDWKKSFFFGTDQKYFILSIQDFFYRDIGCMFALMAGFRLLAYLALLRKTARK